MGNDLILFSAGAVDRNGALAEVTTFSSGRIDLHVEDGQEAVDPILTVAEATALMVQLGAAIAAAGGQS